MHRPHLNFISGENGSGKSATLQCLQVCLGVDARKTGRSTTARGLINDAGNHAVAQVTVWNTVSPCPRACACMRAKLGSFTAMDSVGLLKAQPRATPRLACLPPFTMSGTGLVLHSRTLTDEDNAAEGHHNETEVQGSACGALQGSDPYQYALYGPTLTITRKFTRSGTNTYTLAPHSGKVNHACCPACGCAVQGFALLVECLDLRFAMWVHARQAHNIKAAELHAILDHFSIDASNPVICLTQVFP